MTFPANIIRHLCSLGFWLIMFFRLWRFFFLLLFGFSFIFGFLSGFSGFFDPIHLSKSMLAHGKTDLAVPGFALIQAYRNNSRPYLVPLCYRTSVFPRDQP